MSAPSAPVIWRISDGRAGHDNQSAGLAEALARQCGSLTHTLAIQPVLTVARQWLRRQYPPGSSLAKPDLIIGAGRHTHPDMLAAGRYSGAPTVVIMRPDLPYRCFDLCLIPAHDEPPAKKNIIRTRGAINRMQPGHNNADSGVILVGGPSPHHDWNEDSLIEQIENIATRDATIRWTLTDSPRTPATTRSRLAGLQSHDQLFYQPFHGGPPGWLAAALPGSAYAWVSEDSVSMIYEALTAGCRVGLLQLPRRRENDRLVRGIDGLIHDHYVTPFSHWLQRRAMMAPPERLHEADRCARFILEYLLSQRT